MSFVYIRKTARTPIVAAGKSSLRGAFYRTGLESFLPERGVDAVRAVQSSRIGVRALNKKTASKWVTALLIVACLIPFLLYWGFISLMNAPLVDF